jgi:thiol-disulfide isomerase/thioredoxin
MLFSKSFPVFYILVGAITLSVHGQPLSYPVEQTLHIGDKAPELNVFRWIKGQSVTHFQKGMVYIVEFGATWCGPCLASIPHLAALEDKYKNKLTIIDIDIYENGTGSGSSDTAYVKRVIDYVERMDKKINFSVAVDRPFQQCANAWIKATGTTTIPRSFIIDQQGKVAWIGHPVDLDPVIEKAITSTLDPRKEELAQAAEQQIVDSTIDRAFGLKNKGHIDQAISCIDSVIRRYPNKFWLDYNKFELIRQAKDSLAKSMTTLVNGMMNNDGFAPLLIHLAQDLGNDQDIFTLDLAIQVADKGLASNLPLTDRAFLFNAKARAYFFKGMITEAIATEQQGIDTLDEEYKDSPAEAYNAGKKSLERDLAWFKKALKK